MKKISKKELLKKRDSLKDFYVNDVRKAIKDIKEDEEKTCCIIKIAIVITIVATIIAIIVKHKKDKMFYEDCCDYDDYDDYDDDFEK